MLFCRLGAYVVVADEPKRFAYFVGSAPVRLARDVSAAATILADYKWSLRGLEGQAREKAKRECHLRGAQRLVDVFFANGGIYIKLGQHIGMLDHVVPAEYVETLRKHMLDRCPVSTLDQVRATIVEDFGRPPEELFAHFGAEPLASASLAQVHEARDWDGKRLAVKVQHRGLRENSAVDLATIDFLVKVLRLLAPDFDYRWLVAETRENLPKELDFLHEASNSERCRANLDAPQSGVRGRVAVPAVDHARTSHRVITMEFIEGVKVTDLEGLKRLRAPASAVSKLVSETFNEMVFKWGYVHCDPHDGNLFVRQAPKDGGWQLVLLDHGLYRELDDSFRLEYAGLWRSLIFADEEGIRRHAVAMNAGSSVPLFAGMLTNRPWEEVTRKGAPVERLQLKYTEEEAAMIQEHAARYAQEITELLGKMPRQLLLLLKTNDCLRSVDVQLGTPVNTFVITARACIRALSAERWHSQAGLGSLVAIARDVLQVEFRMAVLRLLTWAAEWELWLKGDKGQQQAELQAAQAVGGLPAMAEVATA
ncbi:hypothetical protein N2152v2_007160 [Parachlorella kessleri]